MKKMKKINPLWGREPWAITETAMQTILSVAARENESPEAVASKLGRELQNTYNATERDGVAILPVTGPLVRYANIFTSISGATSYELIAKDFRIALDNPQIKAIILDIDSPGGEVNGVSELSSMIYEARGKKPIIAYASGDAASGAYWIASAADEIVVSETSALGSIGVVGMYRADDENNKTIEIVSSQSPHKRLDVSSDEGRIRLQARIDSMADVFINAIARHRNIDPQTILSDYGGGDVMIGQNAILAGLADRIGSLDHLLQELSQAKAPQIEGLLASQPQSTKEKTPMTLDELKANHPELVTQIQTDARASERKRFEDILGSAEAKGREKLAQEIALGTELSHVEASQLLSFASPDVKANVSDFETAMASTKNPDIQPEGEQQEDDIDAVALRIANMT
jgi:signal peptide peptidase SppA